MPSFVRTIVQLTEELAIALNARSRGGEEPSMAGLLQKSVPENLGDWTARDRRSLLDRARGLIGRFRSGYSDVAENHDQHLDEAYDSSYREA